MLRSFDSARATKHLPIAVGRFFGPAKRLKALRMTVLAPAARVGQSLGANTE